MFAVALRLGLTSFGGPIAHLGYFRNEYVVRRGWLDDHAYSELVGLCQFLPGPASSQVGYAIGWARAGGFGALAAWIGFTLPSAIIMFAFAMAAHSLRGPLAEAVIHGLKLVAVAVVAQALIGMAKTLTPDFRRIAIAAAAAAVMLLVANPAMQVLIIALGGLAGVLLCKPEAVAVQRRTDRAPGRRFGLGALVSFGVILVALPLLQSVNGWLALCDAFYRSGALVFGGGHVVLPLLRQGLVPHWMNDAAFLSGYGAAQALPGPLFSIGSYLGAIAVPADPLGGSAVGIVAIFLPGLLLVTGSLAFREQIMGSELAKRAIAGVNAVVVGLLAAAFYNPLWTTGIATLGDFTTALAALVLLVRFKAPPIVAVALCVAVKLGFAL
ncbi:MAG TPA: chromate efflux transporter [Sphingomicrobium sp.]